MNIYLAHDCFTQGQINQAMEIDDLLTGIFDDVGIYNPSKFEFNDKQESSFVSGYDILVSDFKDVANSDLIILCLDTEDLGVVAEGAYAFSLGLPVFILLTDSRFTPYNGNQSMDDKYEEAKKDIFQLDYKYFNKLISGMAYGNKFGQQYGVDHEVIHRPLIFHNTDDLVEAVQEYVLNGEVLSEQTKKMMH